MQTFLSETYLEAPTYLPITGTQTFFGCCQTLQVTCRRPSDRCSGAPAPIPKIGAQKVGFGAEEVGLLEHQVHQQFSHEPHEPPSPSSSPGLVTIKPETSRQVGPACHHEDTTALERSARHWRRANERLEAAYLPGTALASPAPPLGSAADRRSLS